MIPARPSKSGRSRSLRFASEASIERAASLSASALARSASLRIPLSSRRVIIGDPGGKLPGDSEIAGQVLKVVPGSELGGLAELVIRRIQV